MQIEELIQKIANLEKRIEQLESKPKKPKKHLFVNSEYYDPNKFAIALTGWSSEKMRHYYNACIEYSGAHGEMYCDWILAVRSWDRRTPYLEKNGDTNYQTELASNIQRLERIKAIRDNQRG